jgi:hypothetical protein
MQSASKHLGNQISHRMGNYELQYKTMNGRAVYRKYSETWGSAFLYYDFVSSTKKYWVIGADLGTPDVNLYAPSGVVDATQVRSVSMHTSQTLTHRAQIGPLWHVADPEHHKFVANPSISLVCRQTTDGSSGGESADSSASDGAASRCGETQWRMPYAPLARILTPAAPTPTLSSVAVAPMLVSSEVACSSSVWLLGSRCNRRRSPLKPAGSTRASRHRKRCRLTKWKSARPERGFTPRHSAK